MKKNNLKKPFFAAFLEKQITNTEEINGGSTSPLRDAPTSPLRDNISSYPGRENVTMKYPSDSDEGGEVM